MNTLETLNTWSNDDIAYGGNATYSITFSPTSPVNQTASAVEDEAFASPVGTNITSMVSTPRNIEYTIDLSSVALPATINWGTLPYFLTSQVAGTNIFKLVGPIDETVWAQFKSPLITIIDQVATFTYTATITYPDPTNTANDLTKSWTVTVTVTAQGNISTPSNYTYTKNNIGTIAGSPTITNTAAGTYNIVMTPSIPTAVYLLGSSGSGGTSVFDPVLKTLTLNGTKTEVNSHLASIQFTPVTDEFRSFTFAYSLTNPSGVVNAVTQNLVSGDPFTIAIATYVEDTPFSLAYSVLDQSATATNFTISVAQTTPLANVSPGFFTVNGSNVGNTWTASNTRANINAANVIYTPPVDYTGTLTMTVNQSKIDQGNTIIQVVNQPVNIVNAGTNTEIQNMIDRSYSSNTFNQIFSATTPAITDGPDVGQTYTITLSSALGKFGNSAANAIAAASYSFTGNKTSCNTEFTNMIFVPNYGSASTGTFTYTQTRSSVVQVNLSPVLTGTNASLTPAIYTFTGNSTFVPSLLESTFGNTQVLAVGGGGSAQAGANVRSYSGSNVLMPGGAGGGGEVVFSNYTPLANATYTITPGAGGITATNSPGANITGNVGGTSTFSGGNITLSAVGGLAGNWYVAPIAPYSPTRYTPISQSGGNGGGNITAGNITGGTGAGKASPFFANGQPGVSTGNSLVGTRGGAGGAQGGGSPPSQAGVGVQLAITGSLVLAGGGGAQGDFTYSQPGGNSYGLGGTGHLSSQNGSAGAIIITKT